MTLAPPLANEMLSVLQDTIALAQLHVADPGIDGTSGLAVNTDRKMVTFGDPSGKVMSNDADVTWSNVAGTETYSHISLWDDSAQWLWSGELLAPQAVTVGDDFTIAAGMIVASLT
jgi:hypothetical protein